MLPSGYYHLYNHANGSENLFRSDENYRFFLQQWSKYVAPVAETCAYCLMPNHIHFLIRTKDEIELRNLTSRRNLTGLEDLSGLKSKQSSLEDLSGLKSKQSSLEDLSGFISKQFSNLFNSYAKAYNKMYERRGSLFNRPFKAKEITSDAYLTNVIFYIHHNPVHHGFTTKIEDWPHSSYHALLSARATKLMRKEVNEWFGSMDAMKNFHKQAMKNLNALEMEYT